MWVGHGGKGEICFVCVKKYTRNRNFSLRLVLIFLLFELYLTSDISSNSLNRDTDTKREL